MTLFKLSFRNLRKSMRDYMIYFATLILGVAIFYVFNALGKQTIMLNVSQNTAQLIKLMTESMSVVSVFVSFVLGFLIVYASNFLMKRRKKEFGVYMLLGMGKGKISVVILFETMLIGTISLIAGLMLGIAISQVMSVVVADMFAADMTKFKFVISNAAILKTVLYFVIMYAIVLLMDTFVVGKAKLINLLNAGKKSEKGTNKNPILCVIIFAISCILLGTAYYTVTVGINDIREMSDFVIEIIKGIIATFLFFWSVSGILLYIVKLNKKFYYKGLNCFTIKELGSKINTTVFAGGIISLMLFMTICIFSSAMSVKKSINDGLSEMTKSDVNFKIYTEESEPITFEKVFKDKKINQTMFKDKVEVNSYKKKNLTQGKLFESAKDLPEADAEYIKYLNSTNWEVMKVSDYNKAAALYGNQKYSLKDNEYVVVASFESVTEVLNKALEKNRNITINNKEYTPKYSKCQDGYIEISSNKTNIGVLVVPDSVDMKNFKVYNRYYLANYNSKNQKEYDKIARYLDSDKVENYPTKGYHVQILTKTLIYDQSIGLTAMLVFIGIYIGIIFMISSAAILALKQLSDASDSKEKYQILRKIGVDKKKIRTSLLSQCGMFFGLPLLIAIIHSVFGIQTCVYILNTFGRTGLLYSIIITAAVMVIVYGGYFLITYYCSKKIIES